MSAVAMPFNPTFSLGHPAAPFTWPAGPLDNHMHPDSLVGSEISSLPAASDPSLTPPTSASSLTSSPPRSSFSEEQRELKRQRDRARRDSRLASRLRRVSSQTSYMDSPPPMTIPDVTSAMDMPTFSSASAPMSLLTEPVTAPMSQSYMQPYSPPMHDGSHASQVFPTQYQSMSPGYGMPLDYQTSPYAGSAAYSSRASSVSVGQDAGMIYQVPTVMAPGGVSLAHGAQAGSHEGGGHVRVVQSRPKPRCWDHGCNGRQFSTFSNLLRHQREKSGQATKASCPNCGAVFTRTTARNGHLLHDKCKQRRNS
ncbi:hypothetical protein N3K66_002402 [Trichothecium roseum]|uniref:Uncharacterized protein n=1 Tax=Trichothecium roseum TaxID=47278 RepID=A0ACC0VBH2_9HYPO|nr:hypothetical protein N3K66_002402 [Trichothecium roseum]